MLTEASKFGLRLVNRSGNRLVTGPRVRLLLFLIGLLLVWIGFAKVVVPPVIESAYRGESWPFLNHIIHGQAVHSVDFYLHLWDKITKAIFLGGLGLSVIALVISSPIFFSKFVGEATAGSLGAIRMWTCAVLLLMTSLEDLPSIALLPAEMRSGRGMLEYLYRLPIGFETFVSSHSSLAVFQSVTEVLLFFGVIGCLTRIVIPLAAFCHFLLLGILVDYSFFWHQNLALLCVMLVLSFTPCGDGWSVDGLWKVYQGRGVADADRMSPVYGWARYACWAMIAWPYMANGLSKLEDGGLFWWNAINLRTNLYMDTLKPREYDWVFSLYLTHAPDILFSAMGVFTLFIETCFGVVLFSRVARRIFPIAAIMMHIGIFLLQKILFLDLILLQLIFFDFTAIRKAIGKRLAIKRGRLQVLYDGLCPLCCRTVRLLARFDLFNRLELLDFRQLDLSYHSGRAHALNLRSEDLQEEMYVTFRGDAYRGFYAYRRVALALPIMWPLVPWLFLPWIASFGELVYRHVARNRSKLFWCDAHCPVQKPMENKSKEVSARSRAGRGFSYPLAVSAIVVVSFMCWFYRIEFYPFTSWHLYSGSNTSGKVEYLKVFAQRESGVSSRARFEDAIGALGWDARYSPHIGSCFEKQPRDLETCKKFLAAAASAYNQKAQPGERITQYDIQLWMWDFLSHPSDPHHGKLTDRFIFEINTGRALTEKNFQNRSGAGTSTPVSTGNSVRQ